MTDWKPKFLEQLSLTGNVTGSAEAAGITRQNAYLSKKDDPEFATAWADAIDQAMDDLEASVYRRAKADSDVLAIFLLKAHRPAKYRENVKHEHGGGVTVRVEYVDHDHDYLAEAAPVSTSNPDGSEPV